MDTFQKLHYTLRKQKNLIQWDHFCPIFYTSAVPRNSLHPMRTPPPNLHQDPRISYLKSEILQSGLLPYLISEGHHYSSSDYVDKSRDAMLLYRSTTESHKKSACSTRPSILGHRGHIQTSILNHSTLSKINSKSGTPPHKRKVMDASWRRYNTDRSFSSENEATIWIREGNSGNRRTYKHLWQPRPKERMQLRTNDENVHS